MSCTGRWLNDRVRYDRRRALFSQTAGYGGAAGIRDAGALESALHRPQTGYYDTIVHQAAALLESLMQNHPFVDGNKRVAFAGMDVFLRISGHVITADSKAIHDRMIKLIETRAFDMEHLVPRLQGITKRPRGKK
jgi:death on curing protein